MLLPCPFCGHDLNTQDPSDTIYPACRNLNTGEYIYQIVCQENAGGCSATILGDSKEDCISLWNTRRPDIKDENS